MHLFPFTTIIIFTVLIHNFSLILGQQPYIGLGTVACPRRGNRNSIRGYTCNGANSCQAFLTFRSQPIYDSVSTISTLLGSDPSQLAKINSVSLNDTFETNKLVLVPVNCSCAGEYYQTNTSYVFQNAETYFLVANNTFEGLTTCQALQNQNHNPANIYPGRKLLVPLRCACPTKNQTQKGIRYLLSYLVNWGDSVSLIADKFGVGSVTALEANNLTLTQSMIYPFTTLLIPLHDKPSSSQTVSPAQLTPPPSSPPSSHQKKTWVYVVVGVVAGAVALTSALCAVIFFTRRRKNRNEDESVVVSKATKKKPPMSVNEKLSEIISGIAQSFKVYDFEDLMRATDNFSPSYWIKGSVYRGVINGDLAAIKKIEGDVTKELEILSKINHSNVVRLSGVSFHEGRWYFVYEYAANGDLSEWIYFNNADGKFLSWTQRIQIALDVATGLDYLHSFSSPYIHKDIKSTNILLNGDFRGKVANLSLVRRVEGGDDQFPATRHIVGTRGYMAPEYLEHGLVSTKLVVYAFGVVMLEMITGKEAAAIVTEDETNLSHVLRVMLGEERLKEFVDPSLRENFPFELGMFVVELIDNCISNDPASRPSVPEIVQSLSRTLNSSLSWERSMNVPRS
ncbi:lysM domain receptor-like kinase 4 [Vigna umbellata]|uniref:lysM domain receptor-like kinase 4 n=1 Tax=Vigna umbellata TaxID=87088 RepID=UPI001F5EFEF2|nr:lysM domain receptor-like kinase 4 [Vigna umbellata]